MKWDKPNGARQGTVDGRYVIVQATENNWIAYELTQFGTGNELGVKPTDAEARNVCEDHDAHPARKAG
jgi:hypothetical protein